MGERYKKILGALKEDELARPELIQSRVKLRIAAETGEVRVRACSWWWVAQSALGHGRGLTHGIRECTRAQHHSSPTYIHTRCPQQTVQEINQLMALYANSQALHKWVRRRVQDKKELPRTRSECQVLMMGDPAGISVSNFQ